MFVCTTCGEVVSSAREVSVREVCADRVHYGGVEDQDAIEMDDKELAITEEVRHSVQEACRRFQLAYCIETEATAYACERLLAPGAPGLAKPQRRMFVAAALVRCLLKIYANDYEQGKDAGSLKRKRYDGTDLVYRPPV
jgi:hypothetical protein